MLNIQEAIAQAAAKSPNMNEAQGGGDFERVLPVAGLVRLRLVSYIELGKHAGEYQGKPKISEKVMLTFELSGPKHPPREIEVDGVKKLIPMTITVNENISLNEKANFFRLFKRLNHTGEYTHFAQLLGKGFLGTIVHAADKKDPKIIYANLRDDSGYTIRPAYHEDLEGNSVKVEVDAPLSPLRCFLWNFASKDMWDSLFIDGRWEDKKDDKGEVIKEGASKNYIQNRIKAATNFAGSPIAEILFSGGDAPDLGDAETPARDEGGGASADPLAGQM